MGQKGNEKQTDAGKLRSRKLGPVVEKLEPLGSEFDIWSSIELVLPHTDEQEAFTGCSWIKDTGLANLCKSSLCRGSLQGVNIVGGWGCYGGLLYNPSTFGLKPGGLCHSPMV